MIKDADTIKVVCGSCGSRYTVLVTWMDSAVECDCSGAHLRADVDDMFQIYHHMIAPSEIILHPPGARTAVAHGGTVSAATTRFGRCWATDESSTASLIVRIPPRYKGQQSSTFG